MKVLIIGINGFIGSNLAESFLKRKCRILGTVNNIDNLWRIKDILHSIDIINCKINNIKYFSSIIREFVPDVVVYCGWYGSNSYSLLNDPKQFSENIPGLLDLINILKDINVRCFIGIGAGWEYGIYDKKADEEQTPKPINAYGSSKYVAYQISNSLCNLYGINFLWLRPFWLYGIKDYEKRFIPCLIDKCLKNEDIELNSCLHSVNYLNIEDFCSAVDILIDKKCSGIYNLCGTSTIEIKKIIHNITQLTESKSNITYNKKYPENFIYEFNGCCSKLLNVGWKPKIDINEGLKLTIDYHKNKL